MLRRLGSYLNMNHLLLHLPLTISFKVYMFFNTLVKMGKKFHIAHQELNNTKKDEILNTISVRGRLLDSLLFYDSKENSPKKEMTRKRRVINDHHVERTNIKSSEFYIKLREKAV